MRKFLQYKLLLPISVLAAFSCAKPLDWTDPEGTYEDLELVSVPFSIGVANRTKVTDVTDADDKAIVRWTVYAFDDEDGWMRYDSMEGDGPITLRLFEGRQYTCYAYANYNTVGMSAFKPSTVRIPAELTERVAVLGDNAVGKLLMYGRKAIVPKAISRGAPVEGEEKGELIGSPVKMDVTRMVSRIDVDGVRADFSEMGEDAPKKCILRGIYVTNAYRTNRLGADFQENEISGVRSAWYNSGGYHAGEIGVDAMDELLVEKDLKTTLFDGKRFRTRVSFYTFPNATLAENDDWQLALWTRRCTRVVIEAQIDGITNYYQMDIPEMQRNRVYVLSDVIIHNYGSTQEEAMRAPEGAISYSLEEYLFGQNTEPEDDEDDEEEEGDGGKDKDNEE